MKKIFNVVWIGIKKIVLFIIMTLLAGGAKIRWR